MLVETGRPASGAAAWFQQELPPAAHPVRPPVDGLAPPPRPLRIILTFDRDRRVSASGFGIGPEPLTRHTTGTSAIRAGGGAPARAQPPSMTPGHLTHGKERGRDDQDASREVLGGSLPPSLARRRIARPATKTFLACLRNPTPWTGSRARCVMRILAPLMRTGPDGAAILPFTASTDAVRVAERVRANMEHVAFPASRRSAQQITLSGQGLSRDGSNGDATLAVANLQEAAGSEATASHGDWTAAGHPGSALRRRTRRNPCHPERVGPEFSHILLPRRRPWTDDVSADDSS
jgi:hypothetical protein